MTPEMLTPVQEVRDLQVFHWILTLQWGGTPDLIRAAMAGRPSSLPPLLPRGTDMAVTVVNRDEIPDDLPPGSYCTRLDESSTPDEIRVRFIMPPRKHTRHDCLITVDKAPDTAEGSRQS